MHRVSKVCTARRANGARRKILRATCPPRLHTLFKSLLPPIGKRNSLPLRRRAGPLGPPLIGAVLASLQDAPIDIANFYDGRAETSYGALFDPVHVTTFATYYDFVAYNELRKLGTQVAASTDCPELVTLAASDGEKTAVLLVNPTAQSPKITLDFPCEKWVIIDPRHTYQEIPVPNGTFRLPGLSVSLFWVKK